MILVDDRFKPQDKVGVRRRQIGSHVTTRVVSALTEEISPSSLEHPKFKTSTFPKFDWADLHKTYHVDAGSTNSTPGTTFSPLSISCT